MMLSTANFAAVTLLKPNSRIMLTFLKVDWPQNILLQKMKIITTSYQKWELSIPATDTEAKGNEFFQGLFAVV